MPKHELWIVPPVGLGVPHIGCSRQNASHYHQSSYTNSRPLGKEDLSLHLDKKEEEEFKAASDLSKQAPRHGDQSITAQLICTKKRMQGRDEAENIVRGRISNTVIIKA